jgi:hypothetical protein
MAASQLLRDPQALATAITLLVAGTIAGFFLGRATAPSSPQLSQTSPSRDNEALEIDSDEEGLDDLQTFSDKREEYKLALVVRTDLGMTKGTTL